MSLIHSLIGFMLLPARRDERGLSQSTETAILIAGVVMIAAAIVFTISGFVDAQMAKVK